uniref:Zinc knuckle family protein n=1 Tax=Solanum tuberosum TaxID=4113 RepID=M1B0G3_SOLTU
MLPRRAVRVRPAMKSVEEQELPNALDVQTQEEIKYADRREAIQMLSQVATYHVGQGDNRHEVVDVSRIRELLRMNPPSFSSSSISENLMNLKIQKEIVCPTIIPSLLYPS